MGRKISQLSEQTAITETLSDVDAEIALLEGKLVQGAGGQAGHDVRVADGMVRLV